MAEQTAENTKAPALGQENEIVSPFPEAEIFANESIKEWNTAYGKLNGEQKKAVWTDDHVKLFWQHGLHIDSRFNTRFGLMAAFQALLFNAFVGALGKGLDGEATGKGSPKFFLLAGVTAILGAAFSGVWLYIQRGHSDEIRAATRTAMWLYNIGKMPHYRLVRTAILKDNKRLTDRTQLLLGYLVPATFILLWLGAATLAACWKPADVTAPPPSAVVAAPAAPTALIATPGAHP